MGKVSIKLTNGALGGAVITNDSVSALALHGAGVIPHNEPLVVYSLPDAIDKGINADDEPFLFQEVKEFYSEAPAGTELWLMPMANTATLEDMFDLTAADNVGILLDAANGRIRLLGVNIDPASVNDIGEQIDGGANAAINNAQNVVETYFEKYAPVSVLLPALVIDNSAATITGVPPNANVPGSNGMVVGYVLGGTRKNGIPSVGLALGRAARNTVQRNIGAVEDGSLAIQTGYIGNWNDPTEAKTIQQMLMSGALDAYANMGFITLFGYMQKAGLYWSDDPMAAEPTDDYRSLANVRVINKATIITYQTYINKVNTDILIDKDGKIDAGVAKSLEGMIDNAVNTAMAGEISRFRSYIDVEQNILATGKLKIVEKITPKGYLKEIDVELGFENPNK